MLHCEICHLDFSTTQSRTKHKHKDHSKVSSVFIDGVEVACLCTSQGLPKCPASNCDYERLHCASFMKHMLTHGPQLSATKCAAARDTDFSCFHKKAKVTADDMEGKHHLFSLKLHISHTGPALPDDSIDIPAEDPSWAPPCKSFNILYSIHSHLESQCRCSIPQSTT